jgi:NADH:ubiquinone oxidoreductase subunit E
MDVIEVDLCMGSSCFARGNAQALEYLEAAIADQGLENRVRLSGHLCLETCSGGPNIRIGGTTHHQVNPETVLALLNDALEEQEKLNG